MEAHYATPATIRQRRLDHQGDIIARREYESKRRALEGKLEADEHTLQHLEARALEAATASVLGNSVPTGPTPEEIATLRQTIAGTKGAIAVFDGKIEREAQAEKYSKDAFEREAKTYFLAEVVASNEAIHRLLGEVQKNACRSVAAQSLAFKYGAKVPAHLPHHDWYGLGSQLPRAIALGEIDKRLKPSWTWEVANRSPTKWPLVIAEIQMLEAQIAEDSDV